MRYLVLAASLVLLLDTAPAFAGGTPDDPARVYKLAAPSVVLIEAQSPTGATQGSGVVVGDRQVVTNAHVVREPIGFVLVRQGDQVWRAEVETVDEDHDLASLSVLLRRHEKFPLPSAKRKSTKSLAVGERVYAIGAPLGLERTLSDGLISGLPSDGTFTIVQTTAAISPGSSGGGLFDAKGLLVGVTTLYLKDSQNLNFAVSADDVDALLRRPSPLVQAKYVLSAPPAPAPAPATPTPTAVPAANVAAPTELPTALSSVSAVVVSASSVGPIATGGGLVDKLLAARVTRRLRDRGIWVYASRDEARRAGKLALPLIVEVHSMNIKDTVFYPWKIEMNVFDTTDFTDGSNSVITVWNFNTYGYGGSDVVVQQVAEIIDQTIDDLAAKMGRS